MSILREYVVNADPDDIQTRLEDWENARRVFQELVKDLHLAAKRVPEAFEETSDTSIAAKAAFQTSATKLTSKVQQLTDAIEALGEARAEVKRAQEKHRALEQKLSFEPVSAPDESASKYAQTGPGIDSAQAVQNRKNFQADRRAYDAQQATIADAEQAAARQIEQVDTQNYTSQPPVRALTEEPGSPNDPAPKPPSSPGSYSQIAASRARISKINSNTLYPEGWGHEIIAQEKANIEAHQAENKPEWDGNQWINADGSPAPSTSYAMVETANGLAPLAGGTGGMTAMAVAGGGALLTAGVAKALASKFAAGGASAKAGAPAATSRSAAARSTGARAGAAGARGAGAGAGARGAGGRGAGGRGAGAAGGRGAGAAGGRGAGRAGAGGRGAGVGGRRGGKKRDENGSQNQEWAADYTDDWTETASDVLDPGASRGWVPNPPADGGESGPRQSK
ncbi:hypothetical protein J2S40_003714 [Nocardioides luteus]|nr:hypothetical protein [Nocardioides luteus]MDR7312656.1 hypothetical protein [Nocardioides luteus]